MDKKAIKIGNTPLYYSIYSAESTQSTMHERGVLEIIFCLKGSVRFTYAYEEFTLKSEEFVSVDRDAYYLYKGRDNILVSFYIDLLKYEKKYPFHISISFPFLFSQFCCTNVFFYKNLR